MVILYDKLTGDAEIIYGVLDDDHGYPKFLIRKDNRWVYRSAKHYITREEHLTKFPKTLDELINEIE
jgi:hypothetical protein